MKKKRLVLFIVLCLLLSMAGCMQSIELTDSESDQVAEYAAYLLLKYDKYYSPTLMDHDEFDETKAQLSATPIPTPTPTPVNTQGSISGSGAGSGEEPTDAPVYTLDDITGFKRFTLEYTGHSFEQSFTTDREYFFINAPSGKQILVCKFLFTNVSQKARSLQTTDLKLNYKLHISEKAVLDARVSLLENDIQYLDTEVDAGVGYEAVLLFFVDEEYLNEKMVLKVSNGSQTAEIEIQ